MKYSFDIPRSRGLASDYVAQALQIQDKTVRDLVLHVLIARLAFNDETNLEFETIFDEVNQAIELSTPQADIDILEDIQVGSKLRQYINWLTGQSAKSITVTGGTELAVNNSINNILVDTSAGNIPIYLPPPSDKFVINIKKIAGSGSIIVYPNDAETIDGQDSLSISILYASYQFCSDGTNWFII